MFIDREEANPNKRYKAIGFCRRYRNIFLITSPDGIHWDDKDSIEPVSDRGNEGTFNVIWDPHCQIFRAYSIMRFDDQDKRRVICYTESPSLEGGLGRTPCPCWNRRIGTMRSGGASTALCEPNFTICPPFGTITCILGLVGALYVTAEQIRGQRNQVPCDGAN